MTQDSLQKVMSLSQPQGLEREESENVVPWAVWHPDKETFSIAVNMAVSSKADLLDLQNQLIYFVSNPKGLSGQRLHALGQTEFSLPPEASQWAQSLLPGCF